ncbi:MAG: adenosylcobinamide-GDP ribazoletransferase [Pseudomonadota bacterium]
MEKLLASFALCLGFFSRIPLPAALAQRITPDAKLNEAVLAFPLVGLFIGMFPAIVWYFSSLILAPTIAAGLAIAVGMMLTGALHEDGFADCADGLGATPDREKALEIMRDSRIGTYGALALVTSVGLRWFALATLAPISGFFALLIAYPCSRAAMIIPMRYLQYARKEGLATQASGEIPSGGFETAMVIALIIAILFGWIEGVLALAIGLSMTFLYMRYLEHRIGGYTGDGLGATQQIAEIAILIALSGLWA